MSRVSVGLQRRLRYFNEIKVVAVRLCETVPEECQWTGLRESNRHRVNTA